MISSSFILKGLKGFSDLFGEFMKIPEVFPEDLNVIRSSILPYLDHDVSESPHCLYFPEGFLVYYSGSREVLKHITI